MQSIKITLFVEKNFVFFPLRVLKKMPHRTILISKGFFGATYASRRKRHLSPKSGIKIEEVVKVAEPDYMTNKTIQTH